MLPLHHGGWWDHEESNLDQRVWKPLFYHLTIIPLYLLPLRIELRVLLYKNNVLPLHYRSYTQYRNRTCQYYSLNVASSPAESLCIYTRILPLRIELRALPYQNRVLPLHHGSVPLLGIEPRSMASKAMMLSITP